MARAPPPKNASQAIPADDVSDYGTDPDDDVYDLLAQAYGPLHRAKSAQVKQEAVVASIEDIAVKAESPWLAFKQEKQESVTLKAEDIEDLPIPAEYEPLEQRIHVRLARLQQSLDSVLESNSRIEALISAEHLREAAVEVEYDEENRKSFSPALDEDEQARRREQPPIPDALTADGTKRSMLERFRKKPKKPLSVTDLVSPAWCEQQYEYNLIKFGRKPTTPAMRQGTNVHQKLEEQVHQTVPIRTVSKEDQFALRMINTIEGLRALREDGLTREIEVFGVVEGEVVIGIIDDISTVCPDEEMEAAALEALQNPSPKGKGRRGKKTDQLVEGQRTLKEFLTSSQNGSLLESDEAFIARSEPDRQRRYYIKDVKTRQSPSVPARSSATRPTHMQLMLYHRLLTSLAANEVPADTIFNRYGLISRNTFSDRFIAEIANLKMQSTPTEQAEGSHYEDPLTELLAHNNLASLWSLMITEFTRTFPASSIPSQPIISPLLVAEFRTASSRRRPSRAEIDDNDAEELPAGSFLGQLCFPFEPEVIDAYIGKEMAWWKGERATVGVEVEEAFKCRICEFAEECVWRKTKVEEGLRKVQMRKEARLRSEI